MQRVIDGKLYDTGTATLIWGGEIVRLFRTRNGAYFLVHISPSGDMSIMPLTMDHARTWLENRAPVEIIKRYFDVVDA